MRSVSAFTGAAQVGLPALSDDCPMKRELHTPAERVAWAIDQSGRKLQDLASAVGCTHATLSQWSTGATDLSNAKVRLVLALASELGVNVEWLLTGDGPVANAYTSFPPLVLLAQEISRGDPLQASTAERLLRALSGPI